MHSIFCGPTHTLLLSDDGRVYCCGSGSSYEMGNESTAHVYKPALVPGLKDIPCRLAALATSATFVIAGLPTPHKKLSEAEEKARAAREKSLKEAKEVKDKDSKQFQAGGVLEKPEFAVSDASLPARMAALLTLAHIGWSFHRR